MLINVDVDTTTPLTIGSLAPLYGMNIIARSAWLLVFLFFLCFLYSFVSSFVNMLGFAQYRLESSFATLCVAHQFLAWVQPRWTCVSRGACVSATTRRRFITEQHCFMVSSTRSCATFVVGFCARAEPKQAPACPRKLYQCFDP